MYINYQILTPDEFLAVTKMNPDMWIGYCEKKPYFYLCLV